MPNPQIRPGQTLPCAIAGTYAQGNGGWDGGSADAGGRDSLHTDIWAVDDSGYNLVGEHYAGSSDSGGYSVVLDSGSTHLSITVPFGTPIGTNYAAYYATDGTGAAGTYYYVVFDVPPAAAASYKYTGSVTASGILPISAFALAAPNLYDGAAGDTSTHNAVTIGTSGGGSVYFQALIDLGPAPPAVSQVEFVPYQFFGGGWGLSGSNNGTTWTNVVGASLSGSGSVARTFTAATYRYWQIALTWGTSYPATVGLSDFRLYDGSGIVIGGPSGAPAGPTTYAPIVAVDGPLFSAVSTRGPMTFAPRAAVNTVFTETVVSAARTLLLTTVTLAVFLSLASRGPMSFAPRTVSEGVIFSSSSRAGRVAIAGTTAPPIIAFEPPLFTGSSSRGPMTLAARVVVNAVFSGSGLRQSVALGARTVVLSVFSETGKLTGVVAKVPLPGVVDSRDPFVVLAAELRYLLSLEGNPMTILATTLLVMDKLAASYRINDLSQIANTIAGLPVLIRGGDGVTSQQYGYGADSPILTLLPGADTMIAQAVPSVILAALYRPFISALQTFVSSKLGFASLDAYLTAQNAPSPYSALVHPNFALINFLYLNGQGTQLLSPSNVFAPPTLFGMATITGANTATYTDLSAIPAVNVVNPAPGLSQQGYTASKGVTASITAAVNGTATVTLTAIGQNAAGAAVTGRTWTAVISNLAAGASAAFTPTIAGDRIGDVTGLTVAGAATAGAFGLNSVLERMVS